MSTSQQTIPYAWRLWLSTLEPVLGLTGFYLNHVTPHYLLSQVAFPGAEPYNNPLHPPIPPETQILLDTTTGLYAQNLFLQLILTRARPNDVGLWRIWQGSLIVVDSIMWCGMLRDLHTLGVLGSPGSWSGEQKGNLVGMTVLIAVRWAFVLGWGFGAQQVTEAKGRKKA